MSAHTPTPWRAAGSRTIVSREGQLVAEMLGGASDPVEERRQSILTAVNAHEELVAALRLYVKLDNDNRSGCNFEADDWAECYQAGTAALAKAEGEQ